ncbi:MAG: PDDEXK nuclease domain-containing protein [Verrucomicrobiales bacterium]|nr:PDDEXK nuclease domain-containing protein [Verrucomicrobiales bacterium]
MNFNELVELMERTDAALRQRAARSIDRALVVRNWLLGAFIVEFEQKGADRAQYGKQLIHRLAEILSTRGRRGFSYRSLQLFKKFYLTYREILQTRSAELQPAEVHRTAIVQTPSAQLAEAAGLASESDFNRLVEGFRLSWSHYVFLLQIAADSERKFYEIESARENWSLAEFKRQFNSGLYERLALSRDKTAVQKLSREGQILTKPADAVKDPYVLEFLGLHAYPSYSESELEQAIIDKLEHFLLELGKGFLFHSRQFRLTFDEKHFWVDLVFYNRLLRCFVLCDLKIGDLAHQDLGQMQMYVNYFDREMKTPDENPTVGILLCKTRNDALVEMTLPKENATIFASRYQLYLPSKDELKAQLREITEERETNEP